MNRRTKTLAVTGGLGLAIALGAAQVQAGAASSHIRSLTGPVYARTAAPHRQQMAQDLTGTVVPNNPRPVKVAVPEYVDGCDHDYGAVTQCVPWTIAGTTTAQRCSWLTAHGFGPLAVKGTDRQHLDRNHDKVACGKGDG